MTRLGLQALKTMLRSNPEAYIASQKMRLIMARRQKQQYLRFLDEFRRTPTLDLEQVSRRALVSPHWSREIFGVNEMYAHDMALKEYASIPYDRSLRVIVEHGAYVTEVLAENARLYPAARGNIVLSARRADYLRRLGIPAQAIGPYVHYAKPLYDDSTIAEMKKCLGKTLLFLPVHSSQHVSLQAAHTLIDTVIADLQKNHQFESVLLCGYFLDIENGLFDFIKKKDGYYFVSAGDRLGPMFLSLVRTYISLSDVVATIALGTAAGYSLFLGRPHWIVAEEQYKKSLGGSQQEVAALIAARQTRLHGNYDFSFDEFQKMFTRQTLEIEPSLNAVVSDLWGFDEIQTPQGLRSILLAEPH